MKKQDWRNSSLKKIHFMNIRDNEGIYKVIK